MSAFDGHTRSHISTNLESGDPREQPRSQTSYADGQVDLQRWLIDRGWTAQDLARVLERDASSISRWATGARPAPSWLPWALVGIDATGLASAEDRLGHSGTSENVSSWLAAARERAGLSHEELAKALGTFAGQIRWWESGSNECRAPDMLKLALEALERRARRRRAAVGRRS